MTRGLRHLMDRSALLGAVSVLAAACLIGALHNAASPLGVRFLETAEASPKTSRYSNDTLSIEVVGNASEAARPKPEAALPEWRLDAVRLAWSGETIPPPVAATAAEPALGGANAHQHARKRPQSVTWAQAEQLIRDSQAVLVDARTEDAYRAGKIPGSVSLPFVQFAARIDSFKTNYPPSRLLIIYCADLQCPVSHSLADALLNQLGYQDVRVLAGGYVEWRKETSRAKGTP